MRVVDAPYTFRGGVHPPEKKELSSGSAAVELPLPDLLKVPLSQHLGAPAKAVVSVGDHVRRGDVIGSAAGVISANVHSPTSGTVKAFESLPSPAGRVVQHCVIEPDGQDERSNELAPFADWESRTPAELIERISAAGIVGMGGAGFPTGVKVNPPPGKKIHTLVVNGAECEPYLTADHRLMLEKTERVWTGIRILRKILGAEKVCIAIEANKPDAIELFSRIDSDEGVEVVVLKARYPHGSEKQQIFATMGFEVPSGGLPADVGCVVENVGTMSAVCDAVLDGKPLDSRYVSVTGEAVARPGNFIARCGMSFRYLIEAAGGFSVSPVKIVAGGPMMGFAVSSPDIYVTKTTSGILCLDERHTFEYSSSPCIGCGRCNSVCPMRLLPSEMACAIEADDIDGAAALHVADCFECGSCSFSCPAHRPLVQHFRRAKGVLTLRRMQKKAEEDSRKKTEQTHGSK